MKLLGVLCRFLGHKFGKAKDVGIPFDANPLILRRVKICKRCGIEREVKIAAPIQAHSKSQYKRLVTQGANVAAPKGERK